MSEQFGAPERTFPERAFLLTSPDAGPPRQLVLEGWALITSAPRAAALAARGGEADCRVLVALDLLAGGRGGSCRASRAARRLRSDELEVRR
jgi:hypothetical protein